MSSETQESAQTCPTDNHGFMTDGVLTNGMMTGVLLDGTKVGNFRMTQVLIVPGDLFIKYLEQFFKA